MRKRLLIGIFTCLFSASLFAQDPNISEKVSGPVTFKGSFSGNFFDYFPNRRSELVVVGGISRICIFGESTAGGIYNRISECMDSLRQDAVDVCSGTGASEVVISNLRISQSNSIGWTGTGNTYGHILILYGDALCLK